ncbi:titin [Musca vetustissima]|uniref:titin n=1 Tax=Musca vetustissima TaxID=27455 RepID=UPI002AB66E6A|nr:titin [Musca vetustissima]
MELDTDLSKIQSEELLRKMWQQSEDINRKKEIRSQLYKLRESRLRDLYQFDIMADSNVAGFGKDPLAPSHGESFGDQSFQSLKSKEIRDSMSPSELKFQSMALNNPSSTGWNVQSSSEVTPDGRGFRAETIATTDGVEHINGGTAEFKGRNEQRSMAMQEGDDKNFVKKASESSNTHLQEKVVIGDENSGRTEIRTSSSTSTSSSKVFQSSSTTEYENGQPVDYHQPKYLMDSVPQRMQEHPPQQYQQRPTQAEPRYEPQYYDDQQKQHVQQTQQYQRNRQETNTSQNVQTNETREQNKRYVDMDKASPEYQQHVQYLMSQPGEIISNSVEYPKPNVKMITTVKRLPDGTIVRNKRYETEETTPTAAPSQTNVSTQQTVTNTNNTQRRDSQQNYQQPKNYQGQPPSDRLRRPSDDVVDNAETVRRHTTTNDDTVETKYSTTKTSNRKFSTETTSETIHEYDDGYQVPSGGPRPKPVTNDFSTHGFPSVRPNKPTQEFANHRPQAMHPTSTSPSQKMTSPPPREAVVPVRGEYEPTVTERRIPTEDGEVVIVSSEKKRSVKHQTNSERIIETDIRSTDDNRHYEQILDTTKTNQDFSTHGFPSVREPQQAPQPRTNPDYSTQGFPSARGPQSHHNTYPDTRSQPSGAMQPTSGAPKTITTPDGEVVVTSQKSHTTKYNTNTERIIETEVLGDDGRPVRRIPVDVEYISDKYTVTTPGDQVPSKGFPSVRSPTKPVADYSTPHGFPSTRDIQKPSTPDYSTQGFPSTRDTPKASSTPAAGQYVSPTKTPTSSTPTKKPSPTVEATERIIHKEKEVDAAHRAFAASLRSSSPVDQTRRDSYSTDGPRHTPRSSVSSTKTFRRDMREGSHDSETSRISSTTVTRQTPPRTVGGKTVVVTERVTSSSSPRGTKSPSPGKNVTTTTTTTTRTVTSKPSPVKDVPKSEPSPRSSPAPTSSRSSPYPSSKSKSPLGEDDQKPLKTHPSRPLSPTSFPSSRSPQIDHDTNSPIGHKDVPNSNVDQHPAHPDRIRPEKVYDRPATEYDSDEPRTVNRENTFEQVDIDRETTVLSQRKPSGDASRRHPEDDVFITEDHIYEDIDSVTRNVKTTTKQLITNEKQPQGRTPTSSGVRPTSDTKRPIKRNEPEKPVPLAPKTQQSPKGTPNTPSQSPRKSLTTPQPTKAAPMKPTTKQPAGVVKQPVEITRKPSKPEIVKHTEVIKTKTTKYAEISQQESPERKKKPQPNGKSPAREPEPQPSGRSPQLRSPRYGSPDREYPSEDEKEPQETPKSVPSTKSPVRQSPFEQKDKPQGKYPFEGKEKPRKDSPERKYPSGDKMKPTQQSGKPIDKGPEPTYPESRPIGQSPKQVYPAQKPSKPQLRGDAPSEPEYPYDTEEEERLTSELTIRTTNENVKTHKEFDILVQVKPQSRSQSKSPGRESPEREYPFGIKLKPRQKPDEPGRTHSDDKPRYRPSETSPTKPEYPRKTKDHPSQEPGKVQPRGDAPSEPEYTYDTEEEERVTNELTFKTTNKNVKTRKEIDILDEDQLITTRKSPQREYPYLGRDVPRNESPERKYPSEDKKQPKQQINESVTKSPDNKPQSRPQYPSGKFQPRENAPLEKEYPSDNEEEECVTSELTIRTTNKNVKTRKEIDVLNGDKPQSRPGSQKEYPIQDRDKPRNESPERKYPSEVTTKPVLKPGEPNRKSPERTHPHDKLQSGPEYPWETKQKPGKSQPSGEAPLKPEYPSDTDKEHHTSEITIKTTNKNVKTRKDIDILVEDETIFTYHGPKKPEDRQPKKEKPLDTEQQPDTDEDVDEFKPDDRKSKYPQKLNEPTSKTPKSTRPNLYETTAEQYIRNDDIKTTNQKNVTTTIHEQFTDSERKYPREEPQEPEDSLRQVAPKSRPENEQPKKPIPSKDDKDFVPISPQQPIDKKPKSSRPSLYETTAEQYIRNDDTRNVTQKTTSTIIHEQFIEAEQRPQKPKATDSEPKGDAPKESKTCQKSPNEAEPEIKDYLQEKQPKEQKPKPFEAKLADYPDKPQEAYTEDNEPSYDRPQQPDENEPRDKKPYSGQPMPKEKYPKDDEPSGKPTTIITNSTQKTTIREKITESEPERPDGAFISKAPEEPVQYPSFVKKGTTRRDTFEDRCREILGMETYGNTPGAYKKRPVNEVELVEEDDKETKKETVQKTTFEVKIEDCDDDDDEPLSINSVKKTLITKKAPETKPVEKKPNEEDKPETSSDSEPDVTYPEEEETVKVTTETEYIDITKKSPVVTKQSPKGPEGYTTTTEEIYITEAKKRLPDTTSDSEPETSERFKENIDKKTKSRSPSSRSPQRSTKDITYETEEVVTESHVDMKKKVSSRSPTRPRSPIQDQKKPSDRSPQRTTREQVVVTKETMTMKPRSPTRPGSPSTEQKKPRSPSISPQRKPKVATYETVEVTDERIETTRKPSSQSPTRPKSPNYETKKPSSRSPQRTPKDTTFETVEVITETTTKTPSSRSPNRSVSPSTKKPYSGSPTSSPQRSTKGTTYETVEVIKEVTKKPKSPTCVDTPKKPTSQSRGTKSTPQKLSSSPERATATEDSEYETVVVTESSTKTTSRSPTRLTERFTASRPKSPTYDTPKKSTSQSPTRGIKSSPQKPSRSPERPTLTEDSEYESVVVTKQTDITKKTTSRSPTRITESKPEPTKRQPSKPDSPTKPTSKKSQYKTNVNEEFITTEKVFVSNVQQDYPDTTSDSEEPEKTQLREVNSKTIEITKKRNETSPTRRPESPMYGSPKDRYCEMIEVTNKRIESPRKPSSKTPTRPNKEPSVGIIEVTQKRSTIDATKKTSTPTKPSLKPTMDSPKQGPKQKPKGPTKSNLNEEFITTEKVYVTGVKKDYPETASDSESEPQETFVETIEITKKKKIDKTSEITKKSPYKTPAKPSVESPKKTPGKTTTTTPKDTKVTTETMKDRLRSSVRKDKTSPKKPDQVDAVSSPETSPTRLTERRRSSNISVNTEIIIDHTESSETTTTKKSKDSVYKEIIDSTTLPEKLSRRMPVTERKESAPVHRVTRKDKDTKMSRSTSENLIKVQKKPENDKPTILTPTSDKKPSPKPSADHRRPNKCFATKSINLSATDRLMTSEDMENVIIDIQHAKSSREPSPDKIVPTPVPAHLDTGKPRYPDVVQEPEDEPKRKPVVKNIPIYEEENNSYVGCHIREVSRRTYEEEEDILCTPLVEAPSSLDYPSISEKSYHTTTVITDDESLLSVHDKVNRFQNIAEEVKKPKTSSPFHREFDDKTRVPDNDDCLLSVDEKVDKFIKSAESLTSKQTTITTARDSKPKEFPEEDDLEVTECPFTTVKLAPSEPQKSPELVRHISRHISRQSDMGEPTTTEHTHRNDTTMHEECISSQTTAEEFVTHRRDQTSAVKQRRPVDDYEDDDDHGGDNDEVHISDIPDDDNDDEELIPHTAMHTIRLEERRQKDILTRPSVFDNSKTRGGSSKPTPSKPTTTKTPTSSSRVNKTQPRYVSPAMKDSEKSRQSTPQQQQQQQPQRPQVKSKHSPKVAATATTTITTSHSTTTNAANKRQPHTQSPQQRRTHPDTDSDYRVSSNKNETSVKSSTTINNRQKPKHQPTTGSINGPKKSPQSPQSTVGKKSPMHTTEQRRTSTTTTHIKNANRSHVEVDDAVSDDDDNVDYVEEFQVVEEVEPNDSETELIINSDTTVRSTNSHTNEEETVKTKQSTTINKKEPTTSSNTVSKSPTSRPKMKEMTPGSMGPSAPLSSPGRSTKDHQPVNLTERSTLLKHSTTNSKYSPSTTETNESFLENRPPVKKTPGQSATYRPKTVITTTESVASRRSLFENHHNNQTKPVAKRPIVPTTTSSPSPSSGRRPSYMDHTKSSLEHIRRDSLEINKTNYTRRPSGGNDDDAPDRNSQVKFDVPQKPRSEQQQLDVEPEEEHNIEEIFDLVILEKLLETVTSYELRRRIRAQIRLVKKNMSNTTSTTTTITTRDTKTKPSSSQVISKKEEKQQHYYYKEEHQKEERLSSSTHTSPERIRTTQVTKVTRRTESPDSKYSSPRERSLSPQTRLTQTRVCSRTHERSPSPSFTTEIQRKEIQVKGTKKKQYENVEHVEEIYRESTPKIRKPKAYYPIDDDEEVDMLPRATNKNEVSEEYDSAEVEERTYKKETTHRRSSRKSISPQSSPDRQKPSTTSSRTTSPQGKKPVASKVSPKSPERKTIITEQQQQQTLFTSKTQPKRTPATSAPLKSNAEPKTPVWADRKNILKSPSATPKRPVTSDSRVSSSSVSRTMKSSTNQKVSSTKSSYIEDDCITSSYGIGPTDENGLPLFGIRALKKKKPQQQQQQEPPQPEPTCETTEEVTGYVVEEKYYSDNKSKPIVERKEIIYSTNPEELEAIKEKVKETKTTTTTLKSIKHDKLESDDEPFGGNSSSYKTRTITSVRSSPEEFLESSTTKYVRRGSVKEMSEKFLQKESASMVSEKTNNYPKAGLILRTNSRKQSRDNDDMDGENNGKTIQYRNDEDDEDDCQVESCDQYIVESESETESIKKTQREFKKVTSTKSSSSRSFLNTKGEEKVITSVDDVLERMRNADNVVEDGDTAEDQEARALLNKFLGASIIMKGVESTIPTIPNVNRETKIITTTTTGGSGRQPAKHEVKTTRVTKSIKSGSSSSPVIETTCDIEEIWDEEILKQLLEQAKTYEERRKIRSRLRELMADRAEKNSCQQTGKEEGESASAAVAAGKRVEELKSPVQRSESSASSEYEIIEEEVTCTESESEEVQETVTETPKKGEEPKKKTEEVEKEEKTSATPPDVVPAETNSSEEQVQKVEAETKESDVTDSGKETTDSCPEKGESSAMPTQQGSMHQQQNKMMQVHQANNQKLASQHSSNPAATSKLSSDRSQMHAPSNNKQKSSTHLANGQTSNPTVTVTAGNNTMVRDLGSNSLEALGSNNNTSGSSSSQRQVDRLGVPQKEDSGTESGEDLRFIAAGLRDQLQMKSDSNIIDDVTCALSRLEASLKEGKDISVDTEKRKALLALVGRLQAGLTSPEKLAEIAAAMSELDGHDAVYGETSSPEADAHRSNRQRFAKRRNRIDRHTVGVSREELADARRYMEDMLIMENICQATTPEAANSNSPPQWFPLEKNASTGSILMHNNSSTMRQNNFLNENYTQNSAPSNSHLHPNSQTAGKRRPVSGDFSVSFGLPSTAYEDSSTAPQTLVDRQQAAYVEQRNADNVSSDTNSKFARFTNKKQLMKRANTIDIAKTKRFNSDMDTDSDAEDRSHTIGLKRTVHPTVKKRVANVVPPFEPKTENDRKFLAFINKQSDKPGLGWTNSRSVSNWTTKFGSLKHTFEAGGSGTVTAAKPPQIPSHIHPRPATQQVHKQPQAPVQNYMSTNQQIAQRLQQEAQRQAEERRIKLEYERMEAERREREKLEMLRQQQQRERMERERLEREYYEREIRERNQRAAQQNAAQMNVPKPIPINEFKHAPQSVFRPIDNGDTQQRGIYKPIPQLPTGPHSWQAPSAVSSRSHEPLSPSSYAPHTRPDNSFITTPPPSSKSPIGLPWTSKPTVDSSSFKSKANKFEERSKYDNYNNGAMLQRHHSLRTSNVNMPPNDDFKKRPSLPNTSDPYGVQRNYHHNDYSANPPLSYTATNPPLSYSATAAPAPPPPTNISFVYNNHTSKPTYLSYPCLPTAVMESTATYSRSREDSLTNPQAVPLVLTSSNPSYCPPQQQQQQQLQAQPAREYMSSSTLDVMSPPDSALTSPSIPAMQQHPQTDYTDDDLDSDNLTEYRAVSKVMAKPQSQTAVTVGRRAGHVSDDEVYGKNSKAAKSLLSTMKNIGNKSNGDTKRPQALQTTKRPEAVTSPQTCLSPDGRAYQAPMVDPIFPDLTNFEPNRKPFLENLAKRAPPAPQQQSPVIIQSQAPTYPPRQCASPTPYVSETQTSYVVTYPMDDTTDDEDQSRYSSYSRSSDAVPVRRSRNTSETSTISSTTTAPMVYTNHVPSPNTSWTTNPINEPTIVSAAGQTYYESAPTQNYASHTMTTSQSTMQQKPLPSQTTPKVPTQYQPSSPAAYTNSTPAPYPSTTTTTAQYQSTSQVPQPSPTKTNLTNPPQYPTSYPSSQQNNNYEVSQPQKQQIPSQVPTNQPKMSVGQTSQAISVPEKTATPTKTKKTVASSASKLSQEKISTKTSLAKMRKSVSEDYQDVKSVTTATSRKASIGKENAISQVEQQKIERQTTDVRRKSLGNTVEYQKMEQRHVTAMESQQTTVQPQQQIYKSSAPPDTPDIVKSSLPKDENQPILKKFGPPQRHHYTPNSYQNPLGKADTTSTTALATSKTEHHTNSVKVTATKSILKTSVSTKAPTVIEKPASPEPEEEYIPRNIVYNNIHAFTAMSARRPEENRSHFEPVIRPNKLSKSDSWNQIVNLQNQASAQKFVPSPTHELRRTKSGHTLSIPKMYEAGLDKTEVTEKQRTVAAYFSGQKSPVNTEQTVVEQTKKSTINRTKTSEKISASRKSMGSHHTTVIQPSGGLTRSATMPHIANLRLLDESNVEDAFEQLIMDAKPQQSCTSTTEKTETKGKDGAVVTTTTKVTTRTVSGTGPKPVSAFAKFKQLDRQNSQQSAKSPTTPTTPGGGSSASPSATGNAPIFRFTDPSLNARAATAKEQLLQWCQSKTKEYENVQITNFSSSWVDGLAFCALIHHFLPDAFDYSKLTPQNRRENFELAFTVADEKAGIAPLLDVEDMVVMKRPDWKCVFVYVQSIYRRFRNCQ